MSSTLEHDPRVIEQRAGLAGAIADYRRRIASGDIGQLPVIVGLVLIGAIFEYFSHGVFLSPFNLVNLTLQMAAGGTIAVGLVLILLLGEIDLAAGLTSGLGAAVMAVATTQWGLPAPAGVAVGLVCGAAVGAIQGGWLTRFTVPSFIVTLAGMSIWGGAALLVLGKTGTINLTDPFIVGIANTFFTGWQAYAWAALLLGYVVAGPLRERARRRAAGLTVPPAAGLTVRAVAVGAVVLGIVTILDADRGVSLGLVLLVGVVVGMDFLLRRTRFGRQVYAVGGNAEAARRAGISVPRIRLAVFTLAALFASLGGILGASRLFAVNQSAGRGTELLNAIAAAVIGGTSLFGGRGSVWAALLGIMVIQSISNGMDLLSLSPPIKSIITGAVLLLTVTIDEVLRRGRGPSRR